MALVSIGVPTYNGAEFIEECLKCLQMQTFEDFEVLIADNASTDQTGDICQRFSRSDSRFKYFKFEENVPATQNFSRVRELGHARYFMWRADDDLSDHNHLAGLVDALQKTPDASLAVSQVLRVIQEPAYRETVYPLPKNAEQNRVEKTSQTLLSAHPSWIYGLWRQDRLFNDWEMVMRNYRFLWAADHLTVLPSILHDRVAFSHEGNFIQRIKRASNYSLDPSSLLEARENYRQIATNLVSELECSDTDRRHIKRAVNMHIERRVAPYLKTLKRVWKYRIMKHLNF